MPKKAKAAEPTPVPKKVKTSKKKAAKDTKTLKTTPQKTLKAAQEKRAKASGKAQVLKSEVVYQGPLFRVTKDTLLEPSGKEHTRDVVRHNGSVVILALDTTKSKKDPYIVMEQQYRHAAGQFLWELPAGKLEPNEDALLGAQRELEEETGYRAKKWKPFVEYYASPGFLGESMKVFLAEGLIPGDAHPEEDESIELRLVKLSEVLKIIEKGGILDGKTLTSVLLYAHNRKSK
jgi:ADP-ribose pyrophosphatase